MNPIPIVALIVTVFLTVFVVRRYRSARAGLPATDERERALESKAGHYAFLASLYWMIALAYYCGMSHPWFGPITEPDAALARGVVGMAVIYALSQGFVRLRARA